MDKLRAQIHTLTLQLEDERSRHVTAVSIPLIRELRHRHFYVQCSFLWRVLSTFRQKLQVVNARTRPFKLIVGSEIAQEHVAIRGSKPYA